MTIEHEDFHDSAYGHLVDVSGDDRWAFGTDFEDPLAGVDTTVPDGVDGAELAEYCLMLGDDALVFSHRLSQWCSSAPDLEEDIALANAGLDLLGQARLLLARAASADADCVPALPDGSPVPHEDALAFFRDDTQFRNVRLVEAMDADFAETIARLAVFASWRHGLFELLESSRDPVLRAVAAKGIKEVAYHRNFAGRWFLTLAQGTAESRQRLEEGLARVWRLRDELFATHPVERRMAEAGVGVDPADLAAGDDAVLDQILTQSGVERPDVMPISGVGGMRGRDGVHTEALSAMLADMQSVARAHPTGRW